MSVSLENQVWSFYDLTTKNVFGKQLKVFFLHLHVVKLKQHSQWCTCPFAMSKFIVFEVRRTVTEHMYKRTLSKEETIRSLCNKYLVNTMKGWHYFLATCWLPWSYNPYLWKVLSCGWIVSSTAVQASSPSRVYEAYSVIRGV